MKRIVISCGSIPARLDSVKFITNRFKGGLAFKTAAHLLECGYNVTVIVWQYTQLPDMNGMPAGQYWEGGRAHIVRVNDVFDYCRWFEENAKDYDAFIMAAAVANLTPSEPYTGKFPSHNYQVGEKFSIGFEIAPRAIDIIKKLNPRACLIGYKLFDGSDEELVRAARLTQRESKANIIFANTPAAAKYFKLAVMSDNTVLPCTFDEHLELITRQMESEYYRTRLDPLTDREMGDIALREAFAVVKLYDQTFPGFGTVAVPVASMPGTFATTSRGHRSEPVLVRAVDHEALEVVASGKATLNAPTLAAALNSRSDVIILHRHDDDPMYQPGECDYVFMSYSFPGTKEEVLHVQDAISKGSRRIKFTGHGDLSILPISEPDWSRYYQQFPTRYFSSPEEMERVIQKFSGGETLELGANVRSEAKYAYDPYVKCGNAINLSWEEVLAGHYDLVYVRNALNYLSLDMLNALLERTEHFIANTFLTAPEEKISESEAAVSDGRYVYHDLRLPNDTLIRHKFFAYSRQDYEELGLQVIPYGKNSALVRK